MKSLLIQSSTNQNATTRTFFEIDPALCDLIAGGTDGCKLTSVWTGDGLSEPTLDPK